MYYTINTKALKSRVISLPVRVLPVLTWIPKYNWAKDLIRDLLAGLILAIMQVPHSLGNATLAGVPPILGLYTCVFPAFMFFFFTPAEHLTLGTSALISMVVNAPVARLTNQTENPSHTGTDEGQYTETEVVVALAFLIGIIQLSLYFLQVKRIIWLLSEIMMSAYVLGAVMQASVSQVQTIMGIESPSHNGNFRLIYSFIDIFKYIDTFNWLTFVIGTTSAVVLVLYDIIVRPRLLKYTYLPFPIQLLLVIIFSSLSYTLDFEEEWGVEILGDIPTGLPSPEVPNFSLIPEVMPEAFIIALISLSVSISIGKVLEDRYGLALDATQELLAEGAANTFGSFFSSMNASNTTARTLVQVNAGGQTQFAALFSALGLILVLLFLGPLFEPLPQAVLGAIILTAIRSMWLYALDFFRFIRRDVFDGLVWLVIFLTTSLINVDIGIIVGIGLNLLLALYRGFRYKVVEMGTISESTKPGIATDGDDFTHSLREIPKDYSNIVFIRKRKNSDASLPKHVDDGVDVARMEDLRIVAIGGKFNFVNYNNILRKLKTIFGGQEMAAIVDLTDLISLDQTAARKFVALLKLDKEKSSRVIVQPSEQVRTMLDHFNVCDSNVMNNLSQAASVVIARVKDLETSENTDDEVIASNSSSSSSSSSSSGSIKDLTTPQHEGDQTVHM